MDGISMQGTRIITVLFAAAIWPALNQGAQAQAPASDTSVRGGHGVDAMWGYAAPTPYKILQRPASITNHDSPHRSVPTPPPMESRPSSPYAYGWFGGKPSPKKARQFGYFNSYTQWTHK
jgi:hypothetical protein